MAERSYLRVGLEVACGVCGLHVGYFYPSRGAQGSPACRVAGVKWRDGSVKHDGGGGGGGYSEFFILGERDSIDPDGQFYKTNPRPS